MLLRALQHRVLLGRSWEHREVEQHVAVARARSLEMQASRPSDVFPTHCSSGGGIASLALDSRCEDRFLLVGKGNGEVLLHDVALPAPRSVVAHCDRETAQKSAHQFAVSTVSWFAGDNGLFVSGSPDTKALVWDTVAFVPVAHFPLQSAVHQVALSPVAGGATARLMAVATNNPFVRLCDMGSGAHSQVLKGHRAPVLCAAWSPASEYVLATGSIDKTVRLWDVRKSGSQACFSVLDQHNAERRVLGSSSSSSSSSSATKALSFSQLDSQHEADSSRLMHDRGQKRKAMTDLQNTAHNGAVHEVSFVQDGRYLLSAGGDSRLRLWRAVHTRLHEEYELFENTFVNYNCARRGVGLSRLGVFAACDRASPTREPSVFCAMSNQSISCFALLDGEYLEPSKSSTPGAGLAETGHFMRITSLVFRESVQELYSASLDGMLLRWGSAFPNRARQEAFVVVANGEEGAVEQNDDLSDWESEVDGFI